MLKETVVAALAFGQSTQAIGSTSASIPVSPSVVAASMTAVDAEGKGKLELLVLWCAAVDAYVAAYEHSRKGKG